MSLFRILPTAGKEPSPRCCRMIQPLAATSSCGSMKMKPRAWAKDFRTKAVSLKQDEAGAGTVVWPPSCAPGPCGAPALPHGPRLCFLPYNTGGSSPPSRGCGEHAREGCGHPPGPEDRGWPPAWALPPWQHQGLALQAFR